MDAQSLEAGGAPESDEDGVEEVPREVVWLSVAPRVRARWSRARLLARRVAGEALSQAAVAEVIAAEVMSAIGVDGDPGLSTPLHFPRAARPSTFPAHGSREQREGRMHPALRDSGEIEGGMRCAFPPYELPAFLAPLVEDLESADAVELDARFQRALRVEQRWLAEIGPLLREVARSRSYRFRGCSSLAMFARESLGMSPRKGRRCCGSSGPAQIRPSCAPRSRAAACRGCRRTR